MRGKNEFRFHPLNEEKSYGIVVPVVTTAEGRCLLFEVRSRSLHTQPLDLCFPGGRLLDGEAPEDGAVRETKEELLLDDTQLGPREALPAQIGPDGGAVYPFSCKLTEYYQSFSKLEVETVLLIPIHELLRTPPERYGATLVTKPDPGFPFALVHNGESHVFSEKRTEYLFYRHTKGTIWGLTANILKDFLEEEV